jgi:chromosome partitioning protein
MKVITFLNEKGGIGRSTLTAHLGALLSIYGNKVMVIDTDLQGDCTRRLGMKNQPGLYNMLVRYDEYSIADVSVFVPPETYAIPEQPVKGQLFLIPGNRETQGVTGMVDDPELLNDCIQELQDIEYVIIDTNPTPGMLIPLIHNASDYFIVPTQLEADSLIKIPTVIRVAENRGVKLLGIVPNQTQMNTDEHSIKYAALLSTAKQHGWMVTRPIARRINFAESAGIGRMVWHTDFIKKKSAATKEMTFAMGQIMNGLRVWNEKTS